MKDAIDLLLVMTGFASTLIAFGGKTWLEGSEPLVKRVTVRGWLSLAALLAATILGISQKIISHKEDAQKAEEAARERTEAAATEATLQTKLGQEQGDLGQLKVQLADAQQQLGIARQSLSDANHSLADNKHMVAGIAGIDRQMSTQIQSSGEILKSIDSIQRKLQNVALISAVSRAQTNLELAFLIPVTPKRVVGEPDPEFPTDLFFPNWKKYGRQGLKESVSEIDLDSGEGNWGGTLQARLSNTRETPTEFRGIVGAYQYTRPGKYGTEKGLDDATTTLSAGEDMNHIAFRFDVIVWKTAEVSKWLSSFKKGVRVITVEYFLSPSLTTYEREQLVSTWTDMFAKAGSFSLPLLDMDNFRLVYPIKREYVKIANGEVGPVLSMSYAIADAPAIEMEHMLESASPGSPQTKASSNAPSSSVQ